MVIKSYGLMRLENFRPLFHYECTRSIELLKIEKGIEPAFEINQGIQVEHSIQ